MLYRRERTFSPLIAALLALVVGLALGFWLGRVSSPPATLSRLLEPERSAVNEAASLLEIAGLEYARALGGSPQSREATRKDLELAQLKLAGATGLASLYPKPYAEAKKALRGLESGFRQSMALEEFKTSLGSAQAALRALAP